MTSSINVDHPFQSPAVISICSGIRGLERGIERAIGKIRVAAYVEIEAFSDFNMVAQMEQGVVDAAPVWTDIKTFPSAAFHNKIHGIIGGYPCQGESLAGKRKLELDDRFIWSHIEKIIKSVNPVWCFFENVDDHLSGSFPIVLNSLQQMGYTVEAGIFSAEETGAPHERKRLFILAISNSFCIGYNRRRNKHGINEKRKIHSNIGQYKYRIRSEAEGCSENKVEHSNTGGSKEFWKRFESGQEFTAIELSGDGKELSNTNEQRGQLQIERQQPAIKFTQGVASPGYTQHEWEEPRTIEPGVGCTIDGYNFRNDLLRALGNSVVEQTAEIALITLLKKFGIEI